MQEFDKAKTVSSANNLVGNLEMHGDHLYKSKIVVGLMWSPGVHHILLALG